MKRWLSPWVLPLVMLGIVAAISRPIDGAVWIVVSIVLVRLLNGRFELPAEDEPLRRYHDDPKRSFVGALQPPDLWTPS